MSIYQDDSVKNLKFMHGTTDITDYVESGSFTCENILCDEQLSFGSCNSARAQFVTITDLNLTGEQITVSYGNDSEMTNIGVFKVSQQTSKENSEEKTITMYDCVKQFDVDVADWYIGLTFPMTLLAFRNALCTHIGITQESVSLINDSMTVYETIAPSKLNGMDVLKYIGEINGVWAHSSASGTLDWVSLGTVATEIPASVIQGADGVTQKSYTTAPISKLCIRSEDGDIGVSVGTGTETYYVTSNVLCYGLTTEQLTPIATALFGKISGTTYTPTEIYMKADPTIPMGALLTYGGTSFYLLSRSTSGLLFDDIVSDGNQYLTEDTSVESEIEQLRGKSNVLTQTIEGVSDRVTNIEEDYTTYTEFEQKSDEIDLTISQMQSQIDGDITIYYTDEAPTKANYPYWDWTGLYPAEDLYPADDLYFPYPATELQKHLRSMVYDQVNTVTYRFIKEDGQFIWKELQDTDTAVILSKITSLEATTEGLSTSVQSVQLELEDNYYTKSETESAIQQKSDEITASVAGTYATKDTTNTISGEVSLKLNKTDLVSEFNAKANVITLTSDNFNLDKNGNMTCQNATVNGKITSSDATITGGTIDISTSADTSAIQIDRTYTVSSYTYHPVTKVFARGLQVDATNSFNGSVSSFSRWRYERGITEYLGSSESDAQRVSVGAMTDYASGSGSASLYCQQGDILFISFASMSTSIIMFTADNTSTSSLDYVILYSNVTSTLLASYLSFSKFSSVFGVYKVTVTLSGKTIRLKKLS